MADRMQNLRSRCRAQRIDGNIRRMIQDGCSAWAILGALYTADLRRLCALHCLLTPRYGCRKADLVGHLLPIYKEQADA
jgi:hypothetical protein